MFVSYRSRIYVDRAVARVTAIDLDKPIRAGEVQLLDDAEELKHEAEKAPVIAKKTMLMAFLAIVLAHFAQLYSGLNDFRRFSRFCRLVRRRHF